MNDSVVSILIVTATMFRHCNVTDCSINLGPSLAQSEIVFIGFNWHFLRVRDFRKTMEANAQSTALKQASSYKLRYVMATNLKPASMNKF